MPKERLSMRKIREVLRLRYELGRSNREIARSCDIGSSKAQIFVAVLGASNYITSLCFAFNYLFGQLLHAI